jgi:non-homologous end joining protein Ku
VPLPVNVELYARVRSTRNKSFRNLAPSGQPIESKSLDPATGESVSSPRKGWDVGKGQFVVMPPEALSEMSKAEKTKVLRAEQYADLDSIDLSMAINRYAVRPDPDVAASDQAVTIVWNGLHNLRKAYVAPMTMSASNESVLVIYANDDGLWAAALPFVDELYPVPTFSFEKSDQAAALFEQMLEDDPKVGEFDHERYVGECRKRREEIIERVVAGGVVETTPDEPEPQPQPDLMALLAKAVEAKKTTKAVEAGEKVTV